MENKMSIFKNNKGQRVGQTKTQNGREVMFDGQGKRQGTYDPKSNTTRDSQGKRVGSGNQLGKFLK